MNVGRLPAFTATASSAFSTQATEEGHDDGAVRSGVGDRRHRFDRCPHHPSPPQSRSGRGVGALRGQRRQRCRGTRQRRTDQPESHQRRRRANRAQARLRGLRGQRTGMRRPGHPDYVRLLEAGINVVTTKQPRGWSTRTPTNPHSGAIDSSPPPNKARYPCTRRESSQALPPITCRWCCPPSRRRSRRFTPTRSGLYDDNGVPDIMSDALGFGRPLD